MEGMERRLGGRREGEGGGRGGREKAVYLVNDIKDHSSCSKRSGKRLQFRQSIPERERPQHNSKEHL